MSQCNELKPGDDFYVDMSPSKKEQKESKNRIRNRIAQERIMNSVNWNDTWGNDILDIKHPIQG